MFFELFLIIKRTVNQRRGKNPQHSIICSCLCLYTSTRIYNPKYIHQIQELKKSFEFLHFCLWSFGLWLREFSQHGKNFILQKRCALAMLKQTEMLARSTCIFWTDQFFCIFKKWRQCCKCLLRSKVLDCLHRVYLVHAALGRVFLSPTIHSYLSLILRSWTAEPSACQLIVRLSNEYPRPFKTFHNRFHFMPFVCAPWAGASWSLSFESLITS